jgi:hypothetical protein
MAKGKNCGGQLQRARSKFRKKGARQSEHSTHISIQLTCSIYGIAFENNVVKITKKKLEEERWQRAVAAPSLPSYILDTGERD